MAPSVFLKLSIFRSRAVLRVLDNRSPNALVFEIYLSVKDGFTIGAY